MGIRNYLIEGVSCTGKTTICHELRKRGYHAINGDTELAYQGDPTTGEPMEGHAHEHHIWDVDKVRILVADRGHAASYFCGGSRNHSKFSDLFDRIFVLEIDTDTLNHRLARRPETEWGGKPAERRLIARLHATGEDLPRGAVPINAAAPIQCVVDEILAKSSPHWAPEAP